MEALLHLALVAASKSHTPQLMPLPTNLSSTVGCLALTADFAISVPAADEGTAGQLLGRAGKRYGSIVKSDEASPSAYCSCGAAATPLPSLEVSVPSAALKASPVPALGDDETYELRVSSTASALSANTVWGALRGLETFSQLVDGGSGTLPHDAIEIDDAPAFAHRSILIDLGRRLYPLPFVRGIVDALSYAKPNGE